MKTIKTWLTIIATLLCSTAVNAYDFEVDEICYNILSAVDKTVEVTAGDWYCTEGDAYQVFPYYKGNIVVPTHVMYNDIEFDVVAIGDGAFSCGANNNVELLSVVLPEGIDTIGDYAFRYCDNLESVNIPQSVTYIGEYAFYNCYNLELVNIPQSVTYIGKAAFEYCSKISYIKFTNGVPYMENGAFSSIKAALLPNPNTASIWHLGYSTPFSDVKLFLEYGTIYLGDTHGTMTNDWYYILNGLNNEYSIIMYDNTFTDTELTTLLETAGEVCMNGITYSVTSLNSNYEMEVIDCDSNVVTANIASKITYLNHEFTVTSINSSAFTKAKQLVSLSIPNTITNIGKGSFSGCTAIARVTTEAETPVAISENCFDAMAQLFSTLYVPTNSVSAYQAADVWKGFGSIMAITDEKVTGITLNQVTATLTKGNELKLTVIVTPDYATDPSVVWSSNNPDAVTVDNKGVITAIAPGVATITVTANDGSGVSASCEVTVKERMTSIVITDPYTEDNFIQDEDEENICITYTRTLNNTEWNALYVPFEIPVSQLIDDYEVAYINGIHSYDDDDNGEIDRMSMEVVKVKSGTLHANHPYLIKARTEEAKQMSITVNNATLYKAESTTLDCSSVYMKYEITGIYEQMTGSELAGCYALSGGAWKTIESASYLNPFRLYMKISDRGGSPVKVSPLAMTRINIHVKGEEGSTSIEELMMQEQPVEEVVYDLMGRRVSEPMKGHIYIVNGKKRVY